MKKKILTISRHSSGQSKREKNDERYAIRCVFSVNFMVLVLCVCVCVYA